MADKARELAILVGFNLLGYDLIKGITEYSRTRRLEWHFQTITYEEDSNWKRLERGHIDAIVIHATSRWAIERCEELGVPWINVSCKLDPLPRVSVVQDDFAIGALAARTCLEAPVITPALASVPELGFAKKRAEGFLETLEKEGDRPPTQVCELIETPPMGQYEEANTSWAEVEEEVRTFLLGLKQPAFVFCVNDEVARFLFTRAVRYGIDVPEGVRFLGVDNLASPLGAPYDLISSIQLSFYSGGVRAARVLDKLFTSRKPSEDCAIMVPPVGVIHRGSTQSRHRDDPIVDQALRVISTALPRDRLNVASVAERVGCSRRLLEKRFASALGQSPKTAIELSVLARARKLLVDTRIPLNEIVDRAGFSDLRQMNAAFMRHDGVSAKILRRQYHG